MQPSIENTHPGEMTIASARKKAGLSLWIGGSLAVIAVIAVVVRVLQIGRPPADAATLTPPPSAPVIVVVSAPPATAEPPRPVTMHGQVGVPTGATVLVDGVETSPVEDKIEISGPLESIRMVTLRVGTHEETRMVKLTEKGPIPASLVMADQPKAPPAGVGVRPGGGKVPATKGTATTKPGSGTDHNFD